MSNPLLPLHPLLLKVDSNALLRRIPNPPSGPERIKAGNG
jgi:hypothetical protein